MFSEVAAFESAATALPSDTAFGSARGFLAGDSPPSAASSLVMRLRVASMPRFGERMLALRLPESPSARVGGGAMAGAVDRSTAILAVRTATCSLSAASRANSPFDLVSASLRRSSAASRAVAAAASSSRSVSTCALTARAPFSALASAARAASAAALASASAASESFRASTASRICSSSWLIWLRGSSTRPVARSAASSFRSVAASALAASSCALTVLMREMVSASRRCESRCICIISS
mmetsp:Transcript_18419/g.60225  ORF Transcript_18419/g.60225 Transcript_18419/m.60225 type:complete len:240 (-) Transcript_18419:1591-2310(-)